jgi:hypothetical protein
MTEKQKASALPRWQRRHGHRCPECYEEFECNEGACEIEEKKPHGYKGEDRVCANCAQFPLIDLRPITREPDRYQTVVKLFHGHFRSKRWLILGQARLQRHGRSHGPSLWIFDSYLTEGVTDFEHDSAFALRMGLIGVEFRGILYGHTEVQAIIDPQDRDGFHVPQPGYNPMELPDAEQCDGGKHCKWGDKEPHVIVPEGNYVPPSDRELYRKVRGRFVEITFGVPPRETDDE